MLLDLRLAFRGLRHAPAFFITAVVTLALGIGSSTAIFSTVYAVLLRPLPFADPSQLVRVWERKEGGAPTGVSGVSYGEWLERSRAFDGLAWYGDDGTLAVLGTPTGSIQVRNVDVSANFFDVLGVTPVLGPGFSRDGSAEAGTREMIVSHALWQQAFAGDPSIVGKPVRLEGLDGFTVRGVMAPGFAFPSAVDLWIGAPARTMRTVSRRDFAVVGRMKAGVSLDGARADLETVARQLPREQTAHEGWTVAMMPLGDAIVGDQRLAVLTLFAAVGLLLLIGCANVANLLLARGIARQRELGVRVALGASRRRLVRHLLSESCILALAGGGLGWIAAGRVADLHPIALAFCAGVSVAATFIAGLVPALRASHVDVRAATEQEGARGATSASEWRVQRVLVAGELALSLMLVSGAVLLIQSFVRLQAVDRGYDARQVISLEARVPIFRFSARPDIRSRWLLLQESRDLLAALRMVPGVTAAATISDPPLGGNVTAATLTIRPGERRTAGYHRVSDGYFSTIGLPILRGRDFDESDALREAQFADLRKNRGDGAVIVNAAAARLFWPGADAIGQYLTTDLDWAVTRRRVVGVAADARHEALHLEPAPEIFVPFLEEPSFAMTVLARSALPLDRVAPSLQAAIARVDPEVSVANVRMLEDIARDSIGTTRDRTLLIAGFATAALLLSAVGVYGVLSFALARRTREVGIRLALGARAADIRQLIVRATLGVLVAGLAIGLAASLAMTRLIASLLYGVASTDPVSLLGSILVLAAVTVLAGALPVRRAIRTDPAVALRSRD